MNIEFTYFREEERKFDERRAYLELIEEYIGENKFDRKIAFEIKKEQKPPMVDDDEFVVKNSWSERIELIPVNIQEIKMDSIKFMPIKKYKLKERIKILFTGRE